MSIVPAEILGRDHGFVDFDSCSMLPGVELIFRGHIKPLPDNIKFTP